MKAILCALYFGAFTSGALAGDLIKYQSPDGEFAMLLTEADDQGVSIKLIEADSRKVLLDLADTGHPYSEHSKLLWSPDSTRFAFLKTTGAEAPLLFTSAADKRSKRQVFPKPPIAKIKRMLAKNSGAASSQSSG
jgi:hypothetical protein